MSKQQTTGEPTPPAPLTNAQKQYWNEFLDYLDKQGYKGNTALDNKNMALGQNLLNKFNAMRPDNAIKYEDVPRIQAELQQYRAGLVDKWKKGLAKSDEVKTEDDIMRGLSPVDGWLGSKTSSYKFPTAVLKNSDGSITNFGTDVNKYDQTITNTKK